MRRAFTIALLAASCLAAPALAQEAQPQQREDEDIIVTGRTDSQLAVFGDVSVRDAPLSVRVVDEAAIADRGATSLGAILFADPSYVNILGNNELGSGLTSGIIRGFSVGRNFTNGLPQSIDVAFVPAEALQRVEVLRGVAGFNFGFISPGGAVNSVTKTPRGVERSALTLRKELSGAFGGHFETEGAAGELGYRVSFAGSVGDLFVTDTDARRLLAAAAFDYPLGPNTKVFVDGYVQDWDTSGILQGTTGALDVNGDLLPRLSASRQPLPSPDARDDIFAWTVQGRITHDFSDALSLVVSGQYQKYDEVLIFAGYRDRFWDRSGDNVALIGNAPLIRDDFGASARANYMFDTGSIAHTLTVTGQYNHTVARGGFAQAAPYRYNIYTGPLEPPTPLPDAPITFDQRTVEYGVALAYSVEPTDWLRVLLGGRYSNIKVDDRDADTRNVLSSSGNDKLTPFVGVMADATGNLSLYANYSQALERGGRAPAQASNAGEQLPPLVSEQVELGFKWDLFGGGGRLDGAVFQIERPSEFFLGPGTPFVQDGLQRHRGAELVLSGSVLPGLRLTGGVQYLDAKILATSNPAAAGSSPQQVPEWQLALSSEYYVGALPGLSLSVAVFGQSRRELELPNNRGIGGFVKWDVGATYRTEVGGRKLVFTGRVDNIFDRRYLTSFTPLFGAPRLFYLSAGVEF